MKRGFQAGVAKVDITPPLGGPMAGYSARTQGSNDVDDPLYCKALVMRTGDTEVAILTNDLISVPGEVVKQVRGLIRERTGIPTDHILISASHTHFGPTIAPSPYLEVLIQQMASAAQMAQRRLQPASLGVAKGAVSQIMYNRRMKRPDGKVEMVFRLPPPSRDLKFGPTDPEVITLRIDSQKGDPLGSVINFACHGVTSGDNFYGISADYAGYAMGLVERCRGDLCLFAYGTAGDIVPIKREGTSRDLVGTTLGAEALKCLQLAKLRRPSSIQVHRQMVNLPLKDFPSVAQARRDLRKAEQAAQRARDTRRSREDLKGPVGDVMLARTNLSHAQKHQGKKSIRTEVQAIAVGDLVIIGLPGEIFVEIGLEIKRRSSAPNTMVLSLANDAIGYVPTASAYQEGGYEPVWNQVAPTAAQTLIKAALKAIDRVTA